VPPYVLVKFKKAVCKVVETQHAMSNQGCKGDCKGQASLVFTSKAVDLVCYGATNEAISNSRCRGLGASLHSYLPVGTSVSSHPVSSTVQIVKLLIT